MKILIFGASGQVGWELQRSLAPLGAVFGLTRTSSQYCGDLTNSHGLVRTIAEMRPSVVVNAAAYTAVDRAEDDRGTCRLVNADALHAISGAAKKIGALLVHYSTDYVYPGTGNRPWKEDDAPGPLNEYGRTKIEGERAIVNSGVDHIIIRSSWIYSHRGSNFPLTMIRLAKERDSISIVDDQIGAPTSAQFIADVTSHVIYSKKNNSKSGHISEIYNLAAAGETSWFGFATFLFDVMEKSKSADKSRKVLHLIPISSRDYPQKATRPLNSRLDTTKIRSEYGFHIPDWRVDVIRMLTELNIKAPIEERL